MLIDENTSKNADLSWTRLPSANSAKNNIGSILKRRRHMQIHRPANVRPHCRTPAKIWRWQWLANGLFAIGKVNFKLTVMLFLFLVAHNLKYHLNSWRYTTSISTFMTDSILVSAILILVKLVRDPPHRKCNFKKELNIVGPTRSPFDWIRDGFSR
jgi:hypothetical protein